MALSSPDVPGKGGGRLPPLYRTGGRDATRWGKTLPAGRAGGQSSAGLLGDGAAHLLFQIKLLRLALGIYQGLAQVRQSFLRVCHSVEQQSILFGDRLHMGSILSEVAQDIGFDEPIIHKMKGGFCRNLSSVPVFCWKWKIYAFPVGTKSFPVEKKAPGAEAPEDLERVRDERRLCPSGG